MTPLLRRSSFRYLLRHPWLLALSILGVALGVAVVVSIDLANSSANQAFALSAETVTGKATHQIQGASGDFDEGIYSTLRQQGVRQNMAPVVEGYVKTNEGRTFQLLGVDPFAEGPFRTYVADGSGVDLATFMAKPFTGLLAAETARQLGLSLGDTLDLKVGGVDTFIEVAGLIEPSDERSARAMASLMIVDIATAQELLGLQGRLSRIDLLFSDDDAARQTLEASLPQGVELVRSSARTETVEQMTRAFEVNLTALSLLAIVVGMFLIYNTMTFSVVQRRPLIGRLRALGVSRSEVFSLLLGEAFLIGTVGTVLGLLLGIVLGRGLVQLVSQTINDLYYVVTVRTLHIAPWTLLKGLALGIGATMAAALAPAREATQAPAGWVLRRSSEESRIQALLPRLSVWSLLLGAVGIGLLLLPGNSIVLSYAGLFSIIIAFALLTPLLVNGAAYALRPLMGRLFGVLGRMAAAGVAATLSRTAVAVAALMIAIASATGVGIMVDSFRVTVESWLGYALRADVYVQPPSLVFRRGDATVSPEVIQQLRTTPGVAETYSVRHVDVRTDQGNSALVAVETGPDSRKAFRFKDGNPDEVWPLLEIEDAIIISEPYGYRYGLEEGDSLFVYTDHGARYFAVKAIFYDYASDLGIMLMSRPTYERHFDDRGRSGIALYASPGQDVDVLIETLQARIGGMQDVYIRSNRALRELSLDIFDRTFTITAVLRLLAVVVAFIGVLSALMALQLERAREFAVLRANGMTPRQLWQYVTLQTGLMGLFAGLLSLPLGLTLAMVLIHVINKRSFGWTLQVDVSADILVQAVLVALIAAMLAGLYPSWKMSRANPAQALREE